ncbi:H-NS histone family protein [Paraburkholderia sp. Se-20369]|nr:H-NS histone family protein [Paraburkholderia sp. Se-20369]
MSTYRELLGHLEILQKEIGLAREQEANLLAERVKEILAESGIPLHDVLAQHRQNGRGRSSIKQKYWDPQSGATWSGRGRMPRWLVGKDIEQFRLDVPEGELPHKKEPCRNEAGQVAQGVPGSENVISK